MEFSLITLIISFGIIQALFLTMVLLFQNRKSSSTVFLSLLLFVEALGLSEQGLYYSGLIHDFPYALGLSYPFLILRPVLIYFFARSFFEGSVRFKKKHIIHILPFVGYALIFSSLIFSSAETKLGYLESSRNYVWTDSTGGILFFIFNNIIYSAYYFFTWKIVCQARPALKLEKSKRAKWVANFIVFFLYFFVFKYILFWLNGFHVLSNELTSIVVMLISSFTIQLIAWFQMSDTRLPVFNPTSPVQEQELNSLSKALQIDKVYLDDELSIEKLAVHCRMKHDRLSELIRITYSSSFKNVINDLRVTEAKKLIRSDLNGRPVNLLAIAMDSGFNNKVTFYRAFKRSTGMAPSEYVKQMKLKKTLIIER